MSAHGDRDRITRPAALIPTVSTPELEPRVGLSTREQSWLGRHRGGFGGFRGGRRIPRRRMADSTVAEAVFMVAVVVEASTGGR